MRRRGWQCKSLSKILQVVNVNGLSAFFLSRRWMAVAAACCLCDSSSAPACFPALAQSALCLRPSAWITDRASVRLCSYCPAMSGRLAGDALFLCARFERVGRKVSFNGW